MCAVISLLSISRVRSGVWRFFISSNNIFFKALILKIATTKDPDRRIIARSFTENNCSIWIDDQNNETIWKDYLNGTIENTINVNSSSIRSYSLWANSSTLGNATLYFTFQARIFVAENFGLGILIVLLPIMIVGIIIYVIITWKRKKEPHSVRVAMRMVERMKLKYYAKHPEKVPQKENIFCQKCGAKAQDHSDNFCKECGFKLKE